MMCSKAGWAEESVICCIARLVYLTDTESISQGKMSILAPIGTAILGYRVGDIAICQVPARQRRIKIQRILYQPETSGDYHQ
jgi:regulator of nucleoside diphosphate kinase